MPPENSKRPCRALGNSQLKVSRLCLGAMMFGDQTDEPVAREILAQFREESLRVAQQLGEHFARKGVWLSHFATAWVLAHRAVSAVITGPRTFEQWKEYVSGLNCEITPDDEALGDSLVSPGHPSTPGYNDPAYPWEKRPA